MTVVDLDPNANIGDEQLRKLAGLIADPYEGEQATRRDIERALSKQQLGAETYSLADKEGKRTLTIGAEAEDGAPQFILDLASVLNEHGYSYEGAKITVKASRTIGQGRLAL